MSDISVTKRWLKIITRWLTITREKDLDHGEMCGKFIEFS